MAEYANQGAFRYRVPLGIDLSPQGGRPDLTNAAYPNLVQKLERRFEEGDARVRRR